MCRNRANVIDYVASRTYNGVLNAIQKSIPYSAKDLENTIRYLKEYLDVTDVSLHSRVLNPLNNAERLLAQKQKDSPRIKDVHKGVPDFDVFAGKSIRQSMDKWMQKDPYETIEEFKERVNEDNARKKQKELQDIIMEEYVQRFSYKMSITDMVLKPYDANNQTFLISSPYGDIVLVVPRTDNEARNFAENWNNVNVYNQKFVISNKKLALASLTFSTPQGKLYNYSNQMATAYNETLVDANFNEDMVDYSKLVDSGEKVTKPKIDVQEVTVGVPDVDINIPETSKVNDNTFAVIIANEKYTQVPEVPLAAKDGDIFARYCQKTLGLPKENLLVYRNATYVTMLSALKVIQNIANVNNGIRVIFFYAGHGIPNVSSRDAFLMPIDVDGKDTDFCLSLKKLYSDLASIKASSVVVFLDACFSGMTGDGQSLMASARGVALSARREQPEGNLVVFSAASDDETAYPYQDHGHGLFTYFLLKKLQDSKGNVSLGDLSDFIIEQVGQKSLIIN